MGRRRRRIFRVVRRKLPKVYSCPQCGMVAVKVVMKEGNTAGIACGSCNLSFSLQIVGQKEPIDIYNEFVDRFVSGRVGP